MTQFLTNITGRDNGQRAISDKRIPVCNFPLSCFFYVFFLPIVFRGIVTISVQFLTCLQFPFVQTCFPNMKSIEQPQPEVMKSKQKTISARMNEFSKLMFGGHLKVVFLYFLESFNESIYISDSRGSTALKDSDEDCRSGGKSKLLASMFLANQILGKVNCVF